MSSLDGKAHLERIHGALSVEDEEIVAKKIGNGPLEFGGRSKESLNIGGCFLWTIPKHS